MMPGKAGVRKSDKKAARKPPGLEVVIRGLVERLVQREHEMLVLLRVEGGQHADDLVEFRLLISQLFDEVEGSSAMITRPEGVPREAMVAAMYYPMRELLYEPVSSKVGRAGYISRRVDATKPVTKPSLGL
jgi:hypothetical protein